MVFLLAGAGPTLLYTTATDFNNREMIFLEQMENVQNHVVLPYVHGHGCGGKSGCIVWQYRLKHVRKNCGAGHQNPHVSYL